MHGGRGGAGGKQRDQAHARSRPDKSGPDGRGQAVVLLGAAGAQPHPGTGWGCACKHAAKQCASLSKKTAELRRETARSEVFGLKALDLAETDRKTSISFDIIRF